MTGFGTSCGACRFLRRRCTNECVFAPYFSYEDATTHFAAVHKVFGASNVSKLLSHLPLPTARREAAMTISYEALARMENPVYGCVAHILALEHQVASLKEEIEILGSQMATPSIDSQLSLGHHDPNFVDMHFPSDLNCYIDQPNELIYTGTTTENQLCNFGQTNDQFTPLEGWTIQSQDIQNSHWNIPEILFDEINNNDKEIHNILGYQM